MRSTLHSQISPPSKKTASRGAEAGFTLLELMIASIVLLILGGALITVVQVTQSLRNKTQQGLELQQNVRSALNFIGRELINAGSGIPYLTNLNGCPSITIPAGSRLGPLGAAIVGTAAWFVDPCDGTGQSVTKDGEGNNLAAAFQTDMLVFRGGMGDVGFVDQNAPGPTANWGEVVYAENATPFAVGQLILISNGFRVSLGQITTVQADRGLQFSQGQDALLVNAPGTGANPNENFYAAQRIPGGPPPQLIPLATITYFVDSATDPPHPRLKRLANSAAGAAAATAVADDIENFQVTYLVDHDANATTASIPLASPTAAQLPLVRGATISITGRSRSKMDDRAFPDRHTRLTMSQTVFFRNNVRR